MRILHVAYGGGPKRLAPGGGQLGMFQNMCALGELGHEVHLAVVAPLEAVEPEVRERVASVQEVAVPTPLALRPLQRILNPEIFALRFAAACGQAAELERIARRVRPDVIWADSVFALAVAPRASFPVVFGHYDFLFKLKRVRQQTSRTFSLGDLRDVRALRRLVRRPDALTLSALERLELKIAREAAHVMCVSASESDTLRKQGISSTYIPIVGPTIPRPTASAGHQPRFFLFGNHNTAHASALSEIRHKLWPALERLGGLGEWHQIGRPPKHPDEDWQWMERSFDKVHGFVDDLGTVFRIGDVSIIPYRHDTGFRTKFTVAAGYGVASAGFTETFLCAPEFSPSIDCIAERDVEGLAHSLRRILTDPAWCNALGTEARALYERTYTFEAQLPRYAEILSSALAARA